MFCGNRFMLSGSPSTCALDAGITPLPSIFLLIFLVIYVPIKLLRRSSSPNKSPLGPSYQAPNAPLTKWVHYTYIALAVCLAGMRILEIVRLAAANMGVALLPVGLVASVAVLVILCFGMGGLGMGRSRGMEVSVALVSYWALSTILEAVKVARLVTYNNVFPAKGTAYPSSDWLLDNACILGLFVVFLLAEGVHLLLTWRARSYLPAARSASPQLRELEIGKPRMSPGTFIAA